MTLVFVTILPWLLIAVGGWLGYQLVRQNGRILLRLEAIEKQLGSRYPLSPRCFLNQSGRFANSDNGGESDWEKGLIGLFIGLTIGFWGKTA
jgi:hypothetical protein